MARRGGVEVSAMVAHLYKEAIDSGDRYKIHAAGEVLASISNRTDKLPNEHAALMLVLERRASKDLHEHRMRDLKPFVEAKSQAIRDLANVLQTVK